MLAVALNLLPLLPATYSSASHHRTSSSRKDSWNVLGSSSEFNTHKLGYLDSLLCASFSSSEKGGDSFTRVCVLFAAVKLSYTEMLHAQTSHVLAPLQSLGTEKPELRAGSLAKIKKESISRVLGTMPSTSLTVS